MEKSMSLKVALKPINYKICTVWSSSDVCVDKRSYQPTIKDASDWDCESEKFVFVQNLLELSLDYDGDEYVERLVNRVEAAFETMLAAAYGPKFV